MPVRNQNWYNLQATRRYPLDDKSTGVDDSGKFIRDDIIVDCHIRFPNTFGQYLYVQGISVSNNLVTVVFGVSATVDALDGATIAAVSVTKPTATNMNYAIAAVQPGVTGWVAFGPGIETNFTGRYSTPAQTLIGQRNARPYRPLPIPTIGKINLSTALSDLVLVTATTPVTARYIDETLLPPENRLPKYDPNTQQTTTAPIRAILFSTTAPTAEFNPLVAFLGPCGQRPESGTCPKTPIERINGVAPDCETGNINIVGGDGLTIRTFAECGGADITTPLGLEESCKKDPKDQPKGKDDCPCESAGATDRYCWPPIGSGGAVCEEVGAPCPNLPICTTFSECEISQFEVVSGAFRNKTASAPAANCCDTPPGFSEHDVYVATSVGAVNIALLAGCASDWAYDHTISVEVQPRASGIKQNGGLVINHMRVTESGRCKTKYVAAVIDVGSSELQIYRFDGTNLIKENKVAIPTNPTHWYRLTVTAAANNGTTTITATAYNITTDSNLATLTTNISDYEVVNGRVGIFTNSSVAYFNRFEVV